MGKSSQKKARSTTPAEATGEMADYKDKKCAHACGAARVDPCPHTRTPCTHRCAAIALPGSLRQSTQRAGRATGAWRRRSAPRCLTHARAERPACSPGRPELAITRVRTRRERPGGPYNLPRWPRLSLTLPPAFPYGCLARLRLQVGGPSIRQEERNRQSHGRHHHPPREAEKRDGQNNESQGREGPADRDPPQGDRLLPLQSLEGSLRYHREFQEDAQHARLVPRGSGAPRRG